MLADGPGTLAPGGEVPKHDDAVLVSRGQRVPVRRESERMDRRFGDPCVQDTFTYASCASKGGSVNASGSGAPFTFTPDLAGTYTLTLMVTDDDHGVGTDFQTVQVTNVAPIASAGGPYDVSENGSVTLNGSGTNPSGDRRLRAERLIASKKRSQNACRRGTAPGRFEVVPQPVRIHSVTGLGKSDAKHLCC